MFKRSLYIVLTLLSSFLFSQTPKPDKLKQISLSDTVIFTVTTSGCIDAGTVVYKLIRQKNNDRLVFSDKETTSRPKRLTAKNYEVFIYRFRQSSQRFKYADESEKKCTLTSYFKLNDKKQSSDFTNTSCEAEFNPEQLLQQLTK
jgi:hypothetical protein